MMAAAMTSPLSHQMFKVPMPASSPAVIRSESPGRKNPTRSPVSVNMMPTSRRYPPHWMSVSMVYAPERMPCRRPMISSGLAQLAADEGRAGAEGAELGASELAVERHHAAVGAGEDLRGRHVLHRLADHCGDLRRRLHRLARDVDRAHQHVLRAEQADQRHRHARVGALERDPADAALGQQREGQLVLAPLAAERLLPVGVGLDTVAVADVHHRLAGQALDRAVEGRDAPVAHLVHVDVEGRLVELDHVHAERGELARFLADQGSQRHAELRAAAIVGVVDGIGDGHGPGDGELDSTPGLSAEEAHLVGVDRTAPAERRRHRRHVGFVAVAADADRDHFREVHAVQPLDEAPDEVTPRLLAVGDDVDAGLLLVAECQADGVALALLKRRALEAPGRPEGLRGGEPRGLWQTPGYGGVEHPVAWYHAGHESVDATARPYGSRAGGLRVARVRQAVVQAQCEL